MSVFAVTDRPGDSSSRASNARSAPPGSGTAFPSAVMASGPSSRNSTRVGVSGASVTATSPWQDTQSAADSPSKAAADTFVMTVEPSTAAGGGTSQRPAQ